MIGPMLTRTCFLWAFVMGLVSWAPLLYAETFPLPEPIITAPPLACVQLKSQDYTEDTAQAIDKAGFNCVRLPMHWARTETQKGIYNWAREQAWLEIATRHNWTIIFTLGRGNALYSCAPQQTPCLPNGRAPAPTFSPAREAFLTWLGATARTFRDNPHIIWELWNEPDLDAFFPPRANPHQSASLFADMCTTIRTIDPSATIFGPGLAYFPIDDNKKALPNFRILMDQPGLAPCLSGLAFHPYRGPKLESVRDDFAQLRAFLRQEYPAYASMPLADSEWGYSNFDPHKYPPETVAALAARKILVETTLGLTFSNWYEWQDMAGQDPTTYQTNEREDNFGLLTRDGKPKLVYEAVQTAHQKIQGGHNFHFIPTGLQETYVLAWAPSHKGLRLAVWGTGAPRVVSLALRGFSPLHILTKPMPQYFDLEPLAP